MEAVLSRSGEVVEALPFSRNILWTRQGKQDGKLCLRRSNNSIKHQQHVIFCFGFFMFSIWCCLLDDVNFTRSICLVIQPWGIKFEAMRTLTDLFLGASLCFRSDGSAFPTFSLLANTTNKNACEDKINKRDDLYLLLIRKISGTKTINLHFFSRFEA